MPNSITVSIDPNRVAEQLDGETLTTALKPFVKVASRISADNVCAEAKARLQRQLSGTSTGVTVENISVKSDRTGWGWIVDAGNPVTPMLDRWLEGRGHSGFKNPLRHKPFFWASATLEESAHRARIHAAVQAALSQYGLGEGQR
jgi:hypothetical protein